MEKEIKTKMLYEIANLPTNAKIGLLGGSFDPVHHGHLYIARQALNLMKLDRVILLVSPQNPHKKQGITDSYPSRFAACEEILDYDYPYIIASDYEMRNDLTFTAETVNQLKKYHPNNHFVWIMGLDNLSKFHTWQDWQAIANQTSVAVFSRLSTEDSGKSAYYDEHDSISNFHPESYPALQGFTNYEIITPQTSDIAIRKKICYYFDIPHVNISSTELRKGLNSE